MDNETKHTRNKCYTEFSQVTVNEIAKILNVQKQWAYDLIAEYTILGIWCGSRRKYTLADVMTAIKEKQKRDNKVMLELLTDIKKRKINIG